MDIKRYEDMSTMELDVMKEVGSIGTGSAATALSGLLDTQIKMTVPSVSILGYNEAVVQLGDPEEVIAAILVEMDGDMKGIMLFLLKMDFINEVVGSILRKHLTDYSELGEMEVSALTEIGNIIISTYINALSQLANVEIHLSVPAISINMLGGIVSVPMIELGYETDKMMMISGQFTIHEKHFDNNLLMLPDIASLNYLMKKLVNGYE